MKLKKNSLHNTKGMRGIESNEWITPPSLVKCLDRFDLDPCHSLHQDNPKNKAIYGRHAMHVFTIKDDGLSKKWFGRVWLNPPYGRSIAPFMEKMVIHGNGIALIPARTDTIWFQNLVFNRASAILFLRGRIKFFGQEGYAGYTATFPSCLVSYDNNPCRQISNFSVLYHFNNMGYLGKKKKEQKKMGFFVGL